MSQMKTPSNEQERLDLCGWPGIKVADDAWEKISSEFSSFFIAGQTVARQEQTRKWWDIYKEITGLDPDLIPQPTGNCVAAAAADVVQGIQAIEIKAGDRQEFKEVFNPYHYATGRVLIGQNRLRGGAGSLGSWQADAIKKYGVLRRDADNLPAYNKANVDAWGDGKNINGVGAFSDFNEVAAERVCGSAARVSALNQILDALDNGYLCTIAASFGYNMTATGGAKGFHRRNRSGWNHQMSLWGYCLRKGWVAIKNQWGNVHGQLVDLDTGENWPLGFLRVPMEDFEYHIKNAEVIAYSQFDGFPEQRFDYSQLG